MINIKTLSYVALCISFTIIIGAAVYEHLAVWPRAFSAPPASLTMFQGEYGLNAAAFWTKIHPITLLLFIVSLILFWKFPNRTNILVPLIFYIIVLGITTIYFVPELIDLSSTPYTSSIDSELSKRGALWEKLSILRLAGLIFMAIYLFIGLTKISAAKEDDSLE
jgi:hypothetical protein